MYPSGRRNSHLIGLVAAMVLQGCTTQLQVQKITGSEAPQGQVYYLPKAELEVTHQQKLKECKTDIRPLLLKAWMDSVRTELRPLVEGLAGVNAPNQKAAESLCPLFGEGFALSSGGTCLALLPVKIAAAEGDTPAEKMNAGLQPFVDDFLRQGVEQYTKKWLDAPLPAGFQPSKSDELQAEWSLKVDQSGSVRPQMLPDLDFAYAIDYEEMSKGWKETAYEVEVYPNGTLKSLNVTIEDKTAEAIGSTLRGLGRLAALAGGFPLDLSAAAVPEAAGAEDDELRELPSFSDFVEGLDKEKLKAKQAANELCTQAALRNLEQQAELSKKLEKTLLDLRQLDAEIRESSPKLTTKETAQKAKKAALEEAEKVLAEMDSEDPKRPEQVAKVATLKEENEALEEEAKNLKKKVTDAQKARTALEKTNKADLAKLRAIEEALTSTVTFVFEPTLEQAQMVHPIPVPNKAYGWLDPDQVVPYCKAKTPNVSTPTTRCVEDVDKRQIPIPMVAYAGAVRPSIPSSFKGIDSENRLVYRQPALARVMVCKKEKCIKNTKPPQRAKRSNRLVDQVTAIPQFGVLATLPLENGSFQDNSLVATFAETGALTKVTYKTDSRVAKGTKLFEESTETLTQFADARRGADKQRTDAETAELESEAARLAAELEVAKAEQALEEFLLTGEAPEPAEETPEEGGGEDSADPGS